MVMKLKNCLWFSFESQRNQNVSVEKLEINLALIIILIQNLKWILQFSSSGLNHLIYISVELEIYKHF